MHVLFGPKRSYVILRRNYTIESVVTATSTNTKAKSSKLELIARLALDSCHSLEVVRSRTHMCVYNGYDAYVSFGIIKMAARSY